MKFSFGIKLLPVLVLAACAQQPVLKPQVALSSVSVDNHAPEQGTGLTEQKLIRAKHYMAASANPLASLGGGAFLVYWDNKAKKLTTFDARETAPKAATPALFLDENGKPMGFMNAVVGGRSVGVPGIPKLLEDVHKRYGKLPWASLFDKPIALAEQGFTVSPRMAKSIEQNLEPLKRYPQTAAYFLPDGKPLAAGTVLKNPEFARSVRLLAEKGSAPFYQGAQAQNIVRAVTGAVDNPGKISMADLKNYRVIEREPVCALYREYEVCGMGAPSSGAIALGEILGVLQNQDMKALGAENIHSWRWIGDASRIAFADRDYYVGDPAFVNVPTRALISQAYLKPRAEEIRKADKALENIQAGKFGKAYAQGMAVELPSTSHLVVVDKDGNVVSMTTSIENAFGSGLMANGYLLNNELTDFAFNPVGADGKTVANSVAGGKRPRSSMAPTIVMKDGKPYLAVGSPGGSRIIGFVAKTLVAHIDWGMDIQAAISLPNMLNRGSQYEIEEKTAAADKAAALEKLGYKVQIRDLNSGVQGIVIGKDGLLGGADPRREGKVMGD